MDKNTDEKTLSSFEEDYLGKEHEAEKSEEKKSDDEVIESPQHEADDKGSSEKRQNNETAEVKKPQKEKEMKTMETEEPIIANAKRCKKCGKYACTCPAKSSPSAALFCSVLACFFALCALCFSIYNYAKKGSYSSTFVDGNATNFVEGSISDIANKVSPSVVSITTETRTQSWYGQSTASAAGTGFIISSEGYVLTNRHVVEDAEEVAIIMDDGKTYSDVKIVGVDPLNDAAILKINNASNLPTVKLGDSKTITIGQGAIAIGNALGLYQNTVTSGIISGIGRSLVASDSAGDAYETLNDMIQTDAAINQGNSGGPLVNATGEVIGINTAVSSANSIGFAIPISSVKGIIKSVIETGEFKRAYLGVRYTNITPEIAKEKDLNVTSGAYVATSANSSSIIKDSAADRAGIKEGDIITSVNGVKIGKLGSLSSLLGEYTVGDTVELTLLRDGKEKTVSATLQEYKEQKSSSSRN